MLFEPYINLKFCLRLPLFHKIPSTFSLNHHFPIFCIHFCIFGHRFRFFSHLPQIHMIPKMSVIYILHEIHFHVFPFIALDSLFWLYNQIFSPDFQTLAQHEIEWSQFTTLSEKLSPAWDSTITFYHPQWRTVSASSWLLGRFYSPPARY